MPKRLNKLEFNSYNIKVNKLYIYICKYICITWDSSVLYSYRSLHFPASQKLCLLLSEKQIFLQFINVTFIENTSQDLFSVYLTTLACPKTLATFSSYTDSSKLINEEF